MAWDLREFISQAEEIGEVRRIHGAGWDMEIGVIKDLTDETVLFDDIPGYPRGYRVLTEMTRSIPRWLLTVNMKTAARDNALAREWKDRLMRFVPVPPRYVESGPVFANRVVGKGLDLLKFPAPRMHRDDDARFLGAGALIITRDLDTGRANIGCMRPMVQGPDALTLAINHGKDTVLIINEYHRRGLTCPVVVVPGYDPTLEVVGGAFMPHAGSAAELDFGGWLRGEPYEVVRGPVTSLPIPAHTELAIEGEIRPGDTLMGGRWAELSGYSRPHPEHAVRVKAVYYRDDPILTIHSASRRTRPPARGSLRGDPRSGGYLWYQLEQAGARGIVGVATYTNFFQVISIRNRYAGQSRQVGFLAMQVSSGAFLGKYTVVVDEEVDPYNVDHVLWAIMRRADPQRAIEIVRYCWSDTMDSALPYDERNHSVPAAPVYNSRCIIDACIPVEWDRDWKQPVVYDQALTAQVLKKFEKELAGRKVER